MTQNSNSKTSLNHKARLGLFCVLLGSILLLGGIPYQILHGLASSSENLLCERLAFSLMSQSSLLLIAGYLLVFSGGLVFWLTGPFSLRRDGWFLICFLAFYLWLPLDLYFIARDLQFAIRFDPAIPLTQDMKDLFEARAAFQPLPLLQMAGYLLGLGSAILQPKIFSKGG